MVCTGEISQLSCYDQFNPNPETVNIDNGGFDLAGLPTVQFQSVNSIQYYAGWGPDVINVAPTSKSLADVASAVSVYGGSSRPDTLNVYDTASSSVTGNQYTVNASAGAGTITRTLGPSTAVHSQSVYYSNLDGAVTLDTDNFGTPVDIEATAPSEPLNVNLGTASTVVSIASQSHTLANLGSPVTLTGGSGSNSLVLYDQKDSTASTLPYVLQATAISRPSSATGYGPSVTYHGFSSGVTLDTDNKGTPIDVEGISAPTTVNVGSANTSVYVAQNAQSLAPFAALVLSPLPLRLNGGAGLDSLVVDDQNDAWPSGVSGSYTVSASAISFGVHNGSGFVALVH